MSVKDYLSVITGGLSIIISLILILISFRMKNKKRIFPVRLTALIILVLGLLSLFELFD